MGQPAVGCQLEAKRSLGRQAQLVFRWLTVDQIAGSARVLRRDARTRAVSFFADHEQKAEVGDTFSEKFLDGADHGGDDAFGVACPSPRQELVVFARGEKG